MFLRIPTMTVLEMGHKPGKVVDRGLCHLEQPPRDVDHDSQRPEGDDLGDLLQI